MTGSVTVIVKKDRRGNSVLSYGSFHCPTFLLKGASYEHKTENRTCIGHHRPHAHLRTDFHTDV
jgi:hypothetical protein